MNHYIECNCTDPNHLLCIDMDTGDDEICIYTQLNYRAGFFKRLKGLVAYLFGRRYKFGNWQESMLSCENIDDLSNLLEHYKKHSPYYQRYKNG